MSIKLLSRETIERITAGEVVERPSSVAKELIENSIDAGASGITVEIRGGGIDYLRVTDNGSGIDASEIKLAFQNHATSKIDSADQLETVGTMGFRGEALPSIAAVSKVTVSSKTARAETGVKLINEGGTITALAPVGCPEGTAVVVSDLFYNVPVRRTFLKKPAYEQTLITELVQKLALGNPGIAFKLIVNAKTAFQTYGDGSAVHAAQAIYGAEYARGVKELNQSEGTFTIRGYIGVGDQAAPTRAREVFFLNGRLINCRALSQALEDACRGRVTIGKYPSCVLFVTTPGGNVDVNVHPSKLEVRFKDEASFKLTAETLLARAFTGDKMASALLPNDSLPEVKKQVTLTPTAQAAPDYARFRQMDIYQPAQPAAQQVKEPSVPLRFTNAQPPKAQEEPAKAPEETRKVPEEPAAVEQTVLNLPPQGEKEQDGPAQDASREISFKLIGVYVDTYILVEMDESLILIDQHAAHERLNYEKYVSALDQGVASQQLLIPAILELTPREMQIVNDSADILAEAGYCVEPFGETTLKVTAVPFIYGSSDMRMLFEEMIDDLGMLKRAEKQRKLDSVIQASCKHAVKGGDRLSRMEIEALLKRMLESGAPPTCPHGRPIMKVYTRRSIEQLFKRIQ